MRICPQCHAKFPDVHYFCPDDGELLEAEPGPAPPPGLQRASDQERMRHLCEEMRSLEEPKVGGVSTQEVILQMLFTAHAMALDAYFRLAENGAKMLDHEAKISAVRKDVSPDGKFNEARAWGLNFVHPWSQRLSIIREMLEIVDRQDIAQNVRDLPKL